MKTDVWLNQSQSQLQQYVNAYSQSQGQLQSYINAYSQCVNRDRSVTLYQHCDYGGYSVRLTPGNYDLNALQARGVWNDDVSSITFQGGASATLFEHNFSGRQWDLSNNVSCFVQYGFNDTPLIQSC